MGWTAQKGWSAEGSMAGRGEWSILTGISALDAVTGGIPYGAITEIFGEDSCGKTSLALLIAAGVQRNGGVAVYMDFEHTLEAEFARALGVDPEELLVARPETGEKAQQMAELMMQNRCANLIVFDTIAAMSPGDKAMECYAHSRMVSLMLGQLAWRTRMANTALVLVNHLRGRSREVVGDTELAAGGWATALRSSLRLRLERAGGRQGGGGESVLVRVVKNERGAAGIEVEWALDDGPYGAAARAPQARPAGRGTDG